MMTKKERSLELEIKISEEEEIDRLYELYELRQLYELFEYQEGGEKLGIGD